MHMQAYKIPKTIKTATANFFPIFLGDKTVKTIDIGNKTAIQKFAYLDNRLKNTIVVNSAEMKPKYFFII